MFVDDYKIFFGSGSWFLNWSESEFSLENSILGAMIYGNIFLASPGVTCYLDQSTILFILWGVMDSKYDPPEAKKSYGGRGGLTSGWLMGWGWSGLRFSIFCLISLCSASLSVAYAST